MKSAIRIGTAAWSIPKTQAQYFPTDGSHLIRYSEVLNAVEINSSFYREHQRKTYVRWAEETPADFRFSVKLSRMFTHTHRLSVSKNELQPSLEGIRGLGKKLAVILVQLPPSLKFDLKTARSFFINLRKIYEGDVALEPRHQTWAEPKAIRILKEFKISHVIADPKKLNLENEIFEEARTAGGFVYYRLHGSPVVYQSRYSGEYIDRLNRELKNDQANGYSAWCIFDNTTFGWATENAIELRERIGKK